MQKSPSLEGYAYLIAKIEEYIRSGDSRDSAIRKAVKHCIGRGVLADYLKKYIEKVIDMLTEEFDQDARDKALKEERTEEIARNMLKEGMSIDTIVKVSELSPQRLEELKAEYYLS